MLAGYNPVPTHYYIERFKWPKTAPTRFCPVLSYYMTEPARYKRADPSWKIKLTPQASQPFFNLLM